MTILKRILYAVLELALFLLRDFYIKKLFFVYIVSYVILDIKTINLLMQITILNLNREHGFLIVTLFILVITLGFVYELSKQSRENTISKSYITCNLENNIFDLISQADALNRDIISDMGSMSKFIEQFNDFKSKEKFNIVMENGNIGVDTAFDISDEIAQKWAEKVNVFNRLIHLKSHNVEGYIRDLVSIESQIREHSNYSIVEHKFTSSDLQSKFEQARLKFRHWD